MKYASLSFLSFLTMAFVMTSGCTKEPTDEELLKSATLHQRSGEFDDAVIDFQLLIQKHPKSDKVPEALFAMGAIYLNSKKEYVKAESVYTKLVMDFPEHPTAEGAAYQRARIFVEYLHKPDSAIAAYELFLLRYPNSIPASSARSELTDLKKIPTPGK
ncbi:MAG: tetratricopeptide repeat protein [Ignavibacteriales bacterium]|nr:tetratricopeptide repeat protein [Ignavibacteriales bacterium]